ncbi:MAG: hypothetical protein ACEY3B_04555 [Wolbachia sp.]
MSKEMVNALKAKVKELKHADLIAAAIIPEGWNEINSGHCTYKDLCRQPDLTINGKTITNEFISNLYSKHKNLIPQDQNSEGDYCPFLKKVFTEMFKHAGAIVPNDSIIEELITNYNQLGYVRFFYTSYSSVFSLESLHLDCNGKRAFRMDCYDPNCLKFSFGMKSIPVLGMENDFHEVCDLSSLVEFKLKCQDGNVTYEDGKVLLTIPKELKNYKVSGKNLFDIIVEYFQKFCEKLGFKFETKVEHSLGEPLKVVSEANASSIKDLKLKVNNPR